MPVEQFDFKVPDIRLAAVCGLFCPACSIYIGNREEPDRIKRLAARFNMPEEEFACDGCRSEKRSFFCRNICKMCHCAEEKNVDFCGECNEYPCEELKTFQKQYPHRIELWKNLERIKEVGFEKWYVEMIERYSCAECGAVNSAYDISCRKCGNTPSCEYVRLHEKEIAESSTLLLP